MIHPENCIRQPDPLLHLSLVQSELASVFSMGLPASMSAPIVAPRESCRLEQIASVERSCAKRRAAAGRNRLCKALVGDLSKFVC